MAFLSSSISFLISQRGSKWGSSGVVSSRRSLLLRLFPSSSWLALERFSSYWSCSFISWFCLVSSSTMATRAWTCWARAVESWLDSIWMWKLIGDYAFDPKYENAIPTDGAKLMKRNFVSWVECVQMDPSSCLDDYEYKKTAPWRWSPVWCLPQRLQCQSQNSEVLCKIKQSSRITVSVSKSVCAPCVGHVRALYMLSWILAVVVDVVMSMPFMVTPLA